MPGQITARQREVYDTIVRFHRQKGFMPTFRDLMALLGIKSPNGLMWHMEALLKKGWIEWPSVKGGRGTEGRVSGGFRPLRTLRLLVHERTAPTLDLVEGGIRVTLPDGPLTLDEARKLAADLLLACESVENTQR